MTIKEYIASLKYIPEVVLSVVEDGATRAIPTKERTGQSNAVIICTSTRTNLKKMFLKLQF